MGKILVTGADGFIGSHLVESLVKSNHEIKAFVMYNSFGSWGWLDHVDKEIKENIEIFSGDIRDPNGVRTAVKGCDAVLHLAALIGIPYSYHSPDSYIDTNIKGTLNVLQASRDLEISKVIHTSTSEVYGTAKFVPITEEHPLQGQSPYSASKIGADQLALSFYSSFKTPIVVIRPFNTYGPRQSARAVIPTIITQLAKGRNKITLGALTPTRDFSFIEDTVSGFITALKSSKTIGEVINLGSSFEISIYQTAKSISEIMGTEIEIIQDEQRIRPENSEVERLFASTKKAKDVMDWSPNYGGYKGFIKGLRETINWFTNKENISHYKHDIYNL